VSLELETYFARIKYSGAREPTLSLLSELHTLHPSAIPFENLDPFFQRPVHIDSTAIEAKLVGEQRGGYCFEQNSLFCDVLTALDFVVTPLAGRVVLRWQEGQPRPALTHRLTLVHLPEGVFIADVGFGRQSPTVPLKLEHELKQTTSHGTYRILRDGAEYELQSGTSDSWLGMYRFTLEPQSPADFELGNWFTSTHPRSTFRQNLIASRVVGDARLNLLNTRMTKRCGDNTEERTIANFRELDRVLVDDFGIEPPESTDAVWDRIPKV
jgi:N-hydroxyarylamine O-acetyltransferase